MLISPVLESPPVPFTVKVSAEVMPALPMSSAVAVGAAVGQRPADRQAGCRRRRSRHWARRASRLALPVMLKLPVGRDRRAVLQQEIPGDAGQAGQRAVAGERAGVGDARIRAVELELAIDRRDLAALEFQKRIVLQEDRPGLHPRRAEPRRRIGDVQGRLDGGAALDVDLAGALESPPVPFTVSVSAEVMPVLPTSTPLPLVLLLVSVPPIVRLVPPPPKAKLGPSRLTMPLPVMLKAPVGRDRRAVLQKEIPGDAGQAGQRAVAAERAGVGDARIRAVEHQSSPLIVVIWPLLNSKSASFSRKTVPVSTPAVPNPAAALATFRVDWTVALPSMLISPVLLSPPARSPSACRPK